MIANHTYLSMVVPPASKIGLAVASGVISTVCAYLAVKGILVYIEWKETHL